MPRKKHYCSLDLGSESMLPPQPTWSAVCRAVRKACLISERHPHTYRHFRSYPTVIAERQRQLSDPYIIHPLSCFSLGWNSIFSLVSIAHMCVSSLRLCFILPTRDHPQTHDIDHILLALHLLCLVDLALRFQVGYLENNGVVILDRFLIACHYLKSWFILDLVSSLPVSYILLCFGTKNMKYVLLGHFMAVLKALRIGKDLNNIVTYLKLFHLSHIYYDTVRNVMLFIISAHWCGCFLYLAPIVYYYWTEQTIPVIYQNATDFSKVHWADRYRRGIFISLAAFMGTGLTLSRMLEAFEMLVLTTVNFYAAMFMIYTFVNLINVYLTKFHSVIRYHELMNQLEEYMRHKQFPAQLKKRVSAFYFYHYQGVYFREDITFKTLSDQLCNEIMLHTCHKLVDKVKLFEGLPASVVGSVLGCLRAEVYLPNDLLVRAGDIGDCMYFIATGTVAVYSLKGVEVCHLEDGAYFGEVALLMKDSKRVATIVAVEITQVYRLDTEDFRRFVLSDPILYERIEILASKRMHETVLLDEVLKQNRDQHREFVHPSTTEVQVQKSNTAK